MSSKTFTASFRDINDFSNARTIAISAGDLSVAVRKEVIRIMESNKNNVLQSVKDGLQELLERELIDAKELEALQEVCELVFKAIRGKIEGEDAFFSIKKIYTSMLFNQNSSPAALAIASVSSSAFDFEKSNSVKVTITPGNAGSGAVIGGIIGGIVGGIVGGGFGAGIGAAIGGAAGAAIGWCNDKGV
jgi:hypothetical protein